MVKENVYNCYIIVVLDLSDTFCENPSNVGVKNYVRGIYYGIIKY